MKIIKFFLIFIFLVLFNYSVFALDNNYEAVPPFLQKDVYSNLYLILDYSGSMGWDAYNGSYDSAKTYYGFYRADATYKCTSSVSGYNCDGVWYIDSCTPDNSDCFLGNILNYVNMKRVDLLRYTLTGGDISGSSCFASADCSIYSDRSSCSSNSLCKWKDGRGCRPRRKTSCADIDDESTCDSNDICTWNDDGNVITDIGEEIKYTDVSNYDPVTGSVEGILQKIGRKTKRPRIGAILFSSNIIENISPRYDYSSMINSINDRSAYGYTGTSYAVSQAKEYFEDEDAYTFDVNGESFSVRCAKNFNLLMSDGDWNTGGEPLPTIDSMWNGGEADLMSSLDGNQNAKTYTMAMFMDPNSGGYTAMQHFAVFGGYEDLDSNSKPCNYSDDADDVYSLGDSLPEACNEWDSAIDDDELPDQFFKAENPDELRTAIESVFSAILNDVSSGSSVAVLTDKRKEGSIMSQAVFYPSYRGVPWIGKLFNYWFYNSLTAQNVREDTDQNFDLNVCGDNGDDDGGDRILLFGYDDANNKTYVDYYGSKCDGNIDNTTTEIIQNNGTYDTLEGIKSLVEESDYLSDQFNNNVANRTIYTNCDSNNDLEELNSCSASSYFGSDLGCLSSVSNLINYVYGKNIDGCLNRQDEDGTYRILGDIIYSTPRIVNYDNVSLIFVAANDGMLHAFRVGKTIKTNIQNKPIKLRNEKDDDDTDLIGKEEWAFIPKNALPYLRYRAQNNFEHLYINDSTPYIYEDGNKKILIGSMRMGGAVNPNGDNNAITPPNDTCSDPSSDSCVGRSSYYALDISEPNNPKLLWEFTDKYLGFSYSGPAIIRTKDSSGNVVLYVMFLTGMKNYIAESAYKGTEASVYILKLNSDYTVDTTYKYPIGDIDSMMQTENVYSNRLFNNGVDLNNDGYTDAVFFAFSYVQTQNNSTNWTSNLYLLKIDDSFPSVNNFDRVMSSLHGAVTSSIVYMPCFDMDYVYFGTGRWFYKLDDNAGANNKLYGVNISCLKNNNCNFSSSVNNADICDEIADTKDGTVVAWEVGLNTAEDIYGKERVISDAGTMDWANTILFTSMQPSEDLCSYGGRSRGWGLNCATGKSILDTSCSPYIVEVSDVTCAYLQTSTAAINQLCSASYAGQDGDRDVSNSQGNGNDGDDSVNNVDNGQTEWFTGTTPETPPIVPPPYSMKKGKLLLWIEK